MQIRIEWIRTKDYMIWLLGCCLLLSSYALLVADDDLGQADSLYPRFIVSRIASFDFFGEPEIEVIIDAAEPMPPAGSEVPINPADVIDMVEGGGGDRYGANLESDLFPSVTLSEEVLRLSPESGFSNNSRFNEGDRRTLEQKLRAFSGGNSDPRPLPEPSESQTPRNPLDWINQSELLQNSQLRVVERANPDLVPLLNFSMADAASNEALEDDWQDLLVVDGSSLGSGEIDETFNEEINLPTTEEQLIEDDTPEVESADSLEDINHIDPSNHPWSMLPLRDSRYLAEYWQEELSDGFYVQIFATLQPLTLREQIERQQGELPLVITATHGRLGMMNRLLVGPLKADELGAVEHQLRLRGVRDYFLITNHHAKT